MTPRHTIGGNEPAAGGGATIEMHLRELDQLFDTLDHSPFREKDLDRNAEDYVVESFKELSPKRGCSLVIHLERPSGLADGEKVVGEAVRVHFSRQAQVLRRRLRRLIRVGLISLVIGLSFLFTFFLLGQFVHGLLGDTRWGTLLHESLVIGGWVAMWKPLEIFLYDWWPILSEKRLHQRLSRINVRLVQSGKNLPNS